MSHLIIGWEKDYYANNQVLKINYICFHRGGWRLDPGHL